MTQTTPSILHDEAAASPASRSIVVRDGVAGMLVRGMIVSGVIALTTLLLMLLRSQGLAFSDMPVPLLITVALVVWIAMMLGVFFSEYPRGDHAAMARLGLATFCRTGFPLLVILVAVNYATRLNSVAACVGILYAVGLTSSLYLEVSRLRLPRLGRQAE